MTLRRTGDGAPLTEDELRDLYDDAPPSYVRAGFVMSADGSIAHGGLSRPLSGESDLTVLRTLRAVADVLLVGAATARAERYRPVRLRQPARDWRARHGRSSGPVLAVVSGSLQLDPDGSLFATAHGDVADVQRTLVLTCATADPGRRRALEAVADVVEAGRERVEPALVVAALAERGLARVLCEGGPTLLGMLLADARVDELCLTLSPVLAGAGPSMVPVPLGLVPLVLRHVLSDGQMLALRYVRG